MGTVFRLLSCNFWMSTRNASLSALTMEDPSSCSRSVGHCVNMPLYSWERTPRSGKPSEDTWKTTPALRSFSPTSRETLASSSPSWTWLKYVTSSLRTVCEPQLVPVPWLHAPYSLSPRTLVWVLRRHLSSRLCRSRPRFPREQSKLSRLSMSSRKESVSLLLLLWLSAILLWPLLLTLWSTDSRTCWPLLPLPRLSSRKLLPLRSS